MKIQEFNEANEQFRFVEIAPYLRHDNCHVRRFSVQEWCPLAKKWCRIFSLGRWIISFVSKNNTPLSDDDILVTDSLKDSILKRPKAIIICEEKHGTYYYDASDTETIGLTCIKIIQDRYEQGYYVDLLEMDVPTDEEILKSNTNKSNALDCLNSAINDKNYVNAFNFLSDRADFEYEGFKIQTLLSI